jgi:hypothetical protein
MPARGKHETRTADTITVEWYASLGELIDGLMKNAFAGVNYSLLAVAGSTVALFLTNVWPFLAVFATHGVTKALNGVSVLRFGYVLAFPAAALLFAYIMWRAALLAVIRGSVTWRGTAYPLAKMRANRV